MQNQRYQLQLPDHRAVLVAVPCIFLAGLLYDYPVAFTCFSTVAITAALCDISYQRIRQARRPGSSGRLIISPAGGVVMDIILGSIIIGGLAMYIDSFPIGKIWIAYGIGMIVNWVWYRRLYIKFHNQTKF